MVGERNVVQKRLASANVDQYCFIRKGVLFCSTVRKEATVFVQSCLQEPETPTKKSMGRSNKKS
jgi:hypothetical protein